MTKQDLEKKLISLLVEVKEITQALEKLGFKIVITPPYKDYEGTYFSELNISKPIKI